MAHPCSLLFHIALSLQITGMIVNQPIAGFAAVPTYLDSVCSNETTFSPNSSYEFNLKSLFHSLVSSAATTTNNFDSTVIGDQGHDSVYGYFLCRGDLNSTTCKDCVEAATFELHQSYCPFRKRAVIWYDECLVRYSNKSLFGKLEESPRLVLFSRQNITGNQNRFSEFLRRMMNDLTVQAASDESGKKFAMTNVNLSGDQALYMILQCTPDLTVSDCEFCLKNAITLLRARVSGRVLNPSCGVWYETSLSNIQWLPSELVTSTATSATGKEQLSSKVIVVTVLPLGSILMALLALYIITRRANKYNIVDGIDQELATVESFRYDFTSLQNATNNFSDDSKVAEGVYGCIYKGKLTSGREVLIKKLSRNYGQNEEEFKEEVLSNAKLKHRNLVEFVGFCLDGEERLVVHEFVPNLSLHYYLIDPKRRSQLDWDTRFKIICGIAKGMLYLDQDSWLRIIHCDIRPANILLDADMNAKISHFGLTVTSHKDEIDRNSDTFLGSFGYMSAENTITREFSIQSNVFWFGVLLLAIIGSERYSNLSNFYQLNFAEDLLSQAWKKWREGKPLDFVDPTLSSNPCSSNEVLRCMHIGLLCIQGSPNERPTMASVVFMLHSSKITLQQPEEPAFFFLSETMPKRRMLQHEADAMSCCSNTDSISELQPR